MGYLDADNDVFLTKSEEFASMSYPMEFKEHK